MEDEEEKPCTYHEHDYAVRKCDRCKRPICDYRSLMVSTGSSSAFTDTMTIEFSTSKTKSYYYCVICYPTALDMNIKFMKIMPIIGVSLILLFVMFLTYIVEEWDFELFIPVYLMIGVFLAVLVIAIYSETAKKKKSIPEAFEFKKELPSSQMLFTTKTGSLNMPETTEFDEKYITIGCYECGTILKPSDRFCPKCPKPWQEDREE